MSEVQGDQLIQRDLQVNRQTVWDAGVTSVSGNITLDETIGSYIRFTISGADRNITLPVSGNSKKGQNLIITVESSSPFSAKIQTANTSLMNEVILDSGKSVSFIFDDSKWIKTGSTSDIEVQEDDQTIGTEKSILNFEGRVIVSDETGAKATVKVPRKYDAIVSTVSGCGDYLSVAEAFNDGNKSVFVRNGTYAEVSGVNIPDDGHLIGESAGGVIIAFSGSQSVKSDASGGTKETAGTISVSHNSSTVTGSGTTFTNLSPGDFILLGCSFHEIQSITNDTTLILKNPYMGSALSGEAYVAQAMYTGILIQNIIVTGSGAFGIWLRGVMHGLLRHCLVDDCGNTAPGDDGFGLEDCGECHLVACLTENNNSSGFRILNSYLISFESCMSKNNLHKGYRVQGGKSVFIDSCAAIANGQHGISLEDGAEQVNVTDCILSLNEDKGLDDEAGTGKAIIDSCTISDNAGVGLDFDGTKNAINDCLITGNGSHGIQAGINGVISGNNISDNGGDGISLSSGDDDCVSSNNIIHDNSGDGINCAADDNIINSNRIYGNGGNGLEIISSANDTIVTGNNFKGNTGTNFVDNGTDTASSNNKTS